MNNVYEILWKYYEIKKFVNTQLLLPKQGVRYPKPRVHPPHRFAQFFLSPLFTASATEREVDAVNSENTNNLNNDMWRGFQLAKSMAKPGHPYAKFQTGLYTYLLVMLIRHQYSHYLCPQTHQHIGGFL